MTTRDLRSRLRAQGFPDDHVEVIATTVDEWLADMPDGVDAIDQIVGYAVPYQPTTAAGEAMQIIIDTDTISDSDRALLTSLLSAPMPARVPVDFPAAVKKVGEAAKKAASVVKPPVAKEAGDDPADAVTVAEERLWFGPGRKQPADAVTAEPEPEAPTMADALAAATQAVSKGEQARVKAALASVSSKRVSEMKVEDIPAFLAALSAG